jgi:2-amino-4-hydroxy-6-hydroxymethyldihydropteridine diphosphokinase
LHAAYVGLGSNVGDRLEHLRAAVAALRATPGVVGVEGSPVYATEAHVRPGDPPAPDYLNAVARVTTTLTPEALLARLHAVEQEQARTRIRPWAPRTLDLDLLLHGDAVRPGPGLVLPHPRLALRRFVLAPLADLTPDLVVPAPFSAPVRRLLARCPDRSRCAPTRLYLA